MSKRNTMSFRILCSVICAGFLVFLASIPAFASSFSDHTSVTNHGRIGAVDISLEGKFPEGTTTVLPGQTVDLTSGIRNNGEPAWIRVNLTFPVTDDEVLTDKLPLDDSLVTFASEDWQKIGDYYYLTKPLPTGDLKPLTSAITFPHDWDNTMKNKTVSVHFIAEAIQEAHFTPDFTSEDPWYGAVIEAFDATDYTPRMDGDEQFSIVYQDGAEGLVYIGDDFFANWGDLVPGDKVSGSAMISNQMEIPVRLYFETESSGDTDLLERLQLTIRNGNTVVYDGDLSGEISPAELLMEYEPGTSSTFSYELTVPPELDNADALSDFQVTWIFSAEEVIPEGQKFAQEIVKTGQKIGIGLLVAVGVGMLSGIGYVVTKRKGGVNDETHE